MKTCANCQAELPTPMDEYGPAHAVMCWECFINPKISTEVQDKIAEFQNDIEDIESQIGGFEEQISELEDEKVEIENKISDLKSTAEKMAKHNSKSVKRWITRAPILVAPQYDGWGQPTPEFAQ